MLKINALLVVCFPSCINVSCFIAPKALTYIVLSTMYCSVFMSPFPLFFSLITVSLEARFLAVEANLLLIQHSGTILATVCLRPPTRKFSKGTFSTRKLSPSIKHCMVADVCAPPTSTGPRSTCPTSLSTDRSARYYVIQYDAR